ncbi:MAG: hypothetical protein Phyf2KO_22270 [Phycisphaerales bacterium]
MTVESEVPDRTVCVDFVNEPGCGPSPQNVSSWSQITDHCYEDILKQSDKERMSGHAPEYWWTIAGHFVVDEDGIETQHPEGRGFEVPALIVRDLDEDPEKSNGFSRGFSIPEIDITLRNIQYASEDPDDDTENALKERTRNSELRAYAIFLAMCYHYLSEGDTLQLFICHLGSPLDDGSAPPIVLRLLGFLKPGVRVVVYEGEVKWIGQAGDHSGPRRTVYVRNLEKP